VRHRTVRTKGALSQDTARGDVPPDVEHRGRRDRV
jgi:hypothetical protein